MSLRQDWLRTYGEPGPVPGADAATSERPNFSEGSWSASGDRHKRVTMCSVFTRRKHSVTGAHVGSGWGQIPRAGGGIREGFSEEVAHRQSEKGVSRL